MGITKSGISSDNYYDFTETRPSSKKKEAPKDDYKIKYLSQNLLLVGSADGPIGYLQRSKFDVSAPMQHDSLSYCTVIDLHTKAVYEYGDLGQLIGARDANELEYTYDVYTAYGALPNTDYFGGVIEIAEEVKPKDKKKYSGLLITVNSIILGAENPVALLATKDLNTLGYEAPLERLIRTAIISPCEFDDIFAVEVDRPESPLMRKFLMKLAELVNSNLDGVEDGIDNLEELQKKAYEFAGYEGKSFETVVQEQKDYGKYFRYLLTRGEKMVVHEETKEYFDEFSKLVDQDNRALKSMLKKTGSELFLEGDISSFPELSGKAYFKVFIPNFYIKKDEAIANYFFYVDDIRTAQEAVDKSTLPLKIALNTEVILDNYDTLSKTEGIINNVLICDKNFNFATFSVKKSTLIKWRKKLPDLIKPIFTMLHKGVAPGLSLDFSL